MVISFVNLKGGTGKTTLSYIFATSINDYLKAKMKILVVDSDPQANLSMKLLSDDPKNTLAQVYKGLIKPKKAVYPTIFEDVDIIPSSVELGLIDTPRMNLSRTLKALNYDLVIIDCPPAIGTLTANAVLASDAVIIPISPEEMALKGYELTNGLTEASGRKVIKKVVINLVDRRYSAHKAFVEVIGEALREDLLAILSKRSAYYNAVETHSRPLKTVHGDARRELLQLLGAVVRAVGL